MRLATVALLAGLVSLGGCAGGSSGSGGPPPDRSVTLGASLTGGGAVPPTDSAGTGTLLATLDPGGYLHWELRFSGLSGSPTGVRLYDGDRPVVDLAAAPPQGPVRGTLRLDAGLRADLLAGRWAAELGTATHPGGEIRGPIQAAE
jgi:hypothetical protein